MAVVPYKMDFIPTNVVGGEDTMILTWANMAFTGGVGDIGQVAVFPTWADCSFQFVAAQGGTFGAGGQVIVEGSNDSVNFETLNDTFGVPLSYSVAALRQCAEHAQNMRPRVPAGDATTAINVIALFRRQPSH